MKLYYKNGKWLNYLYQLLVLTVIGIIIAYICYNWFIRNKLVYIVVISIFYGIFFYNYLGNIPFITKQYVKINNKILFKKLSKKCSLKENEIREKLSTLQNIILPSGKKVFFNWIYLFKDNNINGHTNPHKDIYINQYWAKTLLKAKEEDYQELLYIFYHTLGHEMAHRNKEMEPFSLNNKDRVFSRWIVEIYADFTGVVNAYDYKRSDGINAIKYKYQTYKNPDKPDSNHPSWKQRLNYISNYNFNKELIEHVALEVNCYNTRLISDLADFYGKIILRDN